MLMITCTLGDKKYSVDFVSGQIAADCAVLMKNDGTLPLSGTEKLHIAGELFENMRYQGAGSSMIHPTKVTTPKRAFDAHGVKSVALEESDTVLIFAGLTDEYESEGCDRDDMRLPEAHLKLIEDAELKELTRRTVRKLNKLTDAEFASIDFTVYDNDAENEEADHE